VFAYSPFPDSIAVLSGNGFLRFSEGQADWMGLWSGTPEIQAWQTGRMGLQLQAGAASGTKHDNAGKARR
jgi:hypothetical protein